MQKLGGRCVFSSEIDARAQETYFRNFGEVPFGDISDQKVKERIPRKFDVLCAGFPCQAFSIAGKRAGFDDKRGALFFEVVSILKSYRPKAFFLENVKGLLSHDHGNTIRTILKTLREEAGYFVPEPQIVNAKDFGVPQNRERVYIVGFRSDLKIEEFSYPVPLSSKKQKTLEDVLEKTPVSAKFYLSTRYLETLRKHRMRHEAKGNGFGYEIVEKSGLANAISVGGMGRERNLVVDGRQKNLVPQTHVLSEINREGIRRMTPREWARLQGFPEKFQIVVTDAAAYKQFGNSVAVPAVHATAELILKKMKGV